MASRTLRDRAARDAGGGRCEPTPWPPPRPAPPLQREAERTPEKDRKGKKGARWRARRSSQNHSILSGDFREFLALAPSALNHVRQKCEAGKSCRLKSSAPISARLAHNGTAFSPPTCSHFGVWELGA